MKTLRHKFVTEMPGTLEPNTVYVSVEFNTTSHLCCCGCGERVVLKLSPQWWSLTYDGETVSFHPSIGNWLLRCRSHYFIRKSQVVWARSWTQAEIDAGREIGPAESNEKPLKLIPIGKGSRGKMESLAKRILRRLSKPAPRPREDG